MGMVYTLCKVRMETNRTLQQFNKQLTSRNTDNGHIPRIKQDTM